MTWCQAKIHRESKRNTQRSQKYGSLLKRQSRGVTTLHHYKRISSRDLGLHRRETEKEELKQIASWQTSETKEPWEVARLEEMTRQRWTKFKTLRSARGTMNIARTFVGWRIWNESLTDHKEYESTPVEKRNKEHHVNLEVNWDDRYLNHSG